jgi:hypothetical protein
MFRHWKHLPRQPRRTAPLLHARNWFFLEQRSSELRHDGGKRSACRYAIGNITANNPDGARLFSTPETAAALTHALQEHASTPESVQWVGVAIGSITQNNPDGKRLFSTPETAASIINALRNYATTSESVQDVAIGYITADNPEGQRLFSTPETASLLNIALQKYATTPTSVQYVGFAIGNITGDIGTRRETREFSRESRMFF